VRRALVIVVIVGVVVALVIGLVQASDKAGPASTAGPPFDLHAALASLDGSPAPLAALHRQAGKLLDGGAPAFKARLKQLRGHPVVINKWGSWCGPCRSEFPIFQQAGAQHGREVAFLGIDGADNRQEAADFLERFPVTYPSYVDPSEHIALAVGAPANYPITVFIDRRGRRAFIHQGQYRTDAELSRDIRRYLGA
jgi:cytochrome c biogenesis protein CcmG, thiol:disulfide interchange protein DsbE